MKHLGGVYARELAKEMPHMVRGVITLGTPFAASHKSTNAWRISRTDGIVAWQGSIQQPKHNQPAH